MAEKTKRIIKIITSVIAILWIFGEILSTPSWEEPSLSIIIGILGIWGIIMYSLRETSREAKEDKEKGDRDVDRNNINFCANCGNKIEEDVNFCSQCGAKIKI